MNGSEELKQIDQQLSGIRDGIVNLMRMEMALLEKKKAILKENKQ